MKKFLFFGALLLTFHSRLHAFEGLSTVHADTVLKATTSWDGTALTYPTGPAEVTGMVVEIPVGGETGWHLHPVPSFGQVLQGELDVQLKDGRVKKLKAGDALAEVVGQMHNGRNVGTVPVKLVVFYAGATGLQLTSKEPLVETPVSVNKQTVQDYMDGFNKADHKLILSCLTDDVEWLLPGGFDLHGKKAFDKEIENPAFSGPPLIRVTRLSEESDVVIAEGTVLAKKADGTQLRLAFCDVFEMRGGKVKKLTSYLMDTH